MAKQDSVRHLFEKILLCIFKCLKILEGLHPIPIGLKLINCQKFSFKLMKKRKNKILLKIKSKIPELFSMDMRKEFKTMKKC